MTGWCLPATDNLLGCQRVQVVGCSTFYLGWHCCFSSTAGSIFQYRSLACHRLSWGTFVVSHAVPHLALRDDPPVTWKLRDLLAPCRMRKVPISSSPGPLCIPTSWSCETRLFNIAIPAGICDVNMIGSTCHPNFFRKKLAKASANGRDEGSELHNIFTFAGASVLSEFSTVGTMRCPDSEAEISSSISAASFSNCASNSPMCFADVVAVSADVFAASARLPTLSSWSFSDATLSSTILRSSFAWSASTRASCAAAPAFTATPLSKFLTAVSALAPKYSKNPSPAIPPTTKITASSLYSLCERIIHTRGVRARVRVFTLCVWNRSSGSHSSIIAPINRTRVAPMRPQKNLSALWISNALATSSGDNTPSPDYSDPDLPTWPAWVEAGLFITFCVAVIFKKRKDE